MVNDFPKHVAVILDGNRRYAKAKGERSWKGHDAGAETFENFVNWCDELGVNEVTAYVLSTENLKREKGELDHLFALFVKFFERFKKDKKVKEKRLKMRFIGDLSLVPENLRKLAGEIEELTKDYDGFIINFCFAYGGRLELVKAFNKLKSKKGEISEEDITKALWLSDEPDLVIRTGNAMRTSNFLPWQTAYSEWIFLDKMWPEFTKQDLIACIEDFKNRKRNFGK